MLSLNLTVAADEEEEYHWVARRHRKSEKVVIIEKGKKGDVATLMNGKRRPLDDRGRRKGNDSALSLRLCGKGGGGGKRPSHP